MEMRKFKAYLVEHGIKQNQLANLLGITATLVNAKLHGKEPFTLAQVKIICETYKISADEYFI